jgi:hypothetical protein
MTLRTERQGTATEPSPASVRFYRPGDEEGMLRVLQASFARWPAVETEAEPIDHLRWKIGAAPCPEDAHAVAHVDGEIVGMHLCFVREYLHDDERVLVRNDTDNAVLSEWRNQAISALIVETSPAQYVLSSTSQPSLLRLDESLGHRPFRNRLISMSRDLSGEYFAVDGDHVEEIASFDHRIADLWAQAAEPYEFIVAPSVEWLNWRYCDPRAGRGFVLVHKMQGRVAGLLAARISYGKGYIAYLLTLPGREAALSALLNACIERFVEAGLEEAVCALPEHHPYRAFLTAQGFTQHQRRIPLTARPGRPGDLERPFRNDPKAGIHLMLGDTDLI